MRIAPILLADASPADADAETRRWAWVALALAGRLRRIASARRCRSAGRRASGVVMRCRLIDPQLVADPAVMLAVSRAARSSRRADRPAARRTGSSANWHRFLADLRVLD